jgi:hypothetical protein
MTVSDIDYKEIKHMYVKKEKTALQYNIFGPN